MYVTICKEENKIEELLPLIKKYPGYLIPLYKELYKEYPKEVHDTFELLILAIARKPANNRSYLQISALLDMLIDSNGTKKALSIVRRL